MDRLSLLSRSDRLTKNLSPISAKAVLAAQTLIGVSQLAAKYGMSKVSVLRFAGAGYRVRSRMLSPSLSKRWRRMIIVADKPLGKSRLPLDLWLGRGNPISPYLRGIIVELVREECKPKQLILPPDDLTFEGERENFEYTLYHNWSKSWLGWLYWYCTVPPGP